MLDPNGRLTPADPGALTPVGKNRFVDGLVQSYAVAVRSVTSVRRSRAVSWLKSQFPPIPTLLAVVLVQSMYTFSTVAGQTAFLKGSFESVSVELSEQIGAIDTLLDGLNQRIQQRETYRFTNAGMSNFPERRKIFDHDLEERLGATRSTLSRLLEQIRGLRDLGSGPIKYLALG